MNGPTEPNADLRNLAFQMWQQYVALTQVGFSEQQALTIIGQIIAAAFQANSGGDS